MKKLVTTLATLAAFTLPMIAQSDPHYTLSEKIPVVTASIPTTEVPASVITAINTKFDKDNPLTWSSFPYQLKEYGWVYEVGSSVEPLTNYEVTMRTTEGNTMSGIYDSQGDLIETREVSRNIALPRYVREELVSGEFKDWKVVGTRELVQFYKDIEGPRADQVFKLTVEKEKEKRKLTFKYEASTDKYQVLVRR